MSRRRDPLLDAAKGIAILGVVLIHVHAWLGSIGVVSPALDLVTTRAALPLPVFFFVSGLVVASSVVGPGATAATAWSRIAPLLWLYVLWQPLMFGYRVVGDLLVTRDGVDWTGELVRIAVFPIRPNGELWYLWALAIILAAVYLTRRVRTSIVVAAALVLFVVVRPLGILVLGDSGWHQLGPGLQQILPHAVFVVLGTRLGPAIVDVVRRTTWWHCVVVLAVSQAGIVLTLALQGPVRPLVAAVQTLCSVLGTLMVAGLVSRSRSLGFVATLGRGSLPVYILHTTAIVLVLSLVVALHGTGLLERAPSLAAAGLIVLVVTATWCIGQVTARSRFWWLFTLPDGVQGNFVLGKKAGRGAREPQ